MTRQLASDAPTTVMRRDQLLELVNESMDDADVRAGLSPLLVLAMLVGLFTAIVASAP